MCERSDPFIFIPKVLLPVAFSLGARWGGEEQGKLDPHPLRSAFLEPSKNVFYFGAVFSCRLVTASPGSASKSLAILSTPEGRQPNQFSMVKLGTFFRRGWLVVGFFLGFFLVFCQEANPPSVCRPFNRSLF